MAQHDAAGVVGGTVDGGVGGGNAGVGVGAGTNNRPNMVAEPGAQLPTGQMSGGDNRCQYPLGAHLRVEGEESEVGRVQ